MRKTTEPRITKVKSSETNTPSAKIVENFIIHGFQDTLENLLLGTTFPVFMSHSTAEFYDTEFVWRDPNVVDSPQLTHQLIRNGEPTSQSWNIPEPLVFHFVASEGFMIELQQSQLIVNIPSDPVDVDNYYPLRAESLDKELFVGLYYVNDSANETILFETPESHDNKIGAKIAQRIPHRKGTIAYFSANTVYSYSPVTENKINGIIKFVFKKTEKKDKN